MKYRIIKILPVIALLFFVSTSFAQADGQKAAKIDSLLQVYTQKNMFCGSVMVSKKGKILLSKGYGMAETLLE